MGFGSALASMRIKHRSGAVSFFEPGQASDPAYLNLRDLQDAKKEREVVEALWERFAPVADPEFKNRAKKYFHGQFWEMYLYVALLEHGLDVHRAGHKGLDFCVESEVGRIWIEATAPTRGSGKDSVPPLESGVARHAPEKEIILRCTSALRDKVDHLRRAVAANIVSPEDTCVIAINSWECDTWYGGEPPYFLKAFLPIGHLAVAIDTGTCEIVDRKMTHRKEVSKESGSTVPTDTFLSGEYPDVSAVLHSKVQCASRFVSIGEDFCVLHNPRARVPLTEAIFTFCRQIRVLDEGHCFRLEDR